MNDKHIFITGASRGIGAALAQIYAEPGTILGLTAKTRMEELETVANSCREAGATVFTYKADSSDEMRMSDCAKDFIARVSSVDLVIANAGVAVTEDDPYSNSQIARENMNVNYFGCIHTLLPFIERMKALRSGKLVVVSSIASLCSTQNSGAYSASKSAVNLWTEGLRLRLRPFLVSVTTLHVGFVDTDMTKGNLFWMPGLITPSIAARKMAMAIKKCKKTYIFPWQVAVIWSIFRMMPRGLYDLVITWAKNRQRQKI